MARIGAWIQGATIITLLSIATPAASQDNDQREFYTADRHEKLANEVEFWRWPVVLGRTAQYTRKGSVRVHIENDSKLCALSLHEATGSPKFSRANSPRNKMTFRDVSATNFITDYSSPCWGRPVGDVLSDVSKAGGALLGSPEIGKRVGGALKELAASSQQCVGDQRSSRLTMRIYAWTVPDTASCTPSERLIRRDQARRKSPVRFWYGDESR